MEGYASLRYFRGDLRNLAIIDKPEQIGIKKGDKVNISDLNLTLFSEFFGVRFICI